MQPLVTPDRRSRLALCACLLACGVGWLVLPYTPSFMPGEPLPGALPVLQRLFTWWPLSLVAAFAFGLALPRLPADRVVVRRGLMTLQWLLTLASVALILVGLFEALFPRPY